jgi:hypothetical protein
MPIDLIRDFVIPFRAKRASNARTKSRSVFIHEGTNKSINEHLSIENYFAFLRNGRIVYT